MSVRLFEIMTFMSQGSFPGSHYSYKQVRATSTMSCHMGSEIAFKGSKENAQGNEAEVNMAHQSLCPVWMRITPGL